MADSKIAYRTVNVDGVDIFYREAGPKDARTVLLFHGFPSSSHMFRGLIPLLMDKYHIVAPDFPGYGQSSAPPVDRSLRRPSRQRQVRRNTQHEHAQC